MTNEGSYMDLLGWFLWIELSTHFRKLISSAVIQVTISGMTDFYDTIRLLEIKQQWENQKRALEAKQPMDVQMLQGQKRELTMQLDREQAEKQELFMQINSLIAQLADANRVTSDQQECIVLKDENEKLKKQITDILAVQSQLNTDVHNLQEEVRCK
ncbi:unnamed protein product, partial [Brugia pahangi]|uniref:HOOK_N domain-containing protein n=1 Tax=Brugia pahangi TaxID=6280 RepID=A0A0N4TFV2_BRUPA